MLLKGIKLMTFTFYVKNLWKTYFVNKGQA